MAYLSVPSPGKWILDIFWKNIVRRFFGPFFGPGDKTQISRFWPRSFHDRASVPSTRSENQTSHTNCSTRIHLSTSKKNKTIVDMEKGSDWKWPYPLFLPIIKETCSPGRKRPSRWSKKSFSEMSRNQFPGLGTLRLAIWTTYFLFFQIFFGYFLFFDFFWLIVGQIFSIFPVWAAVKYGS